MRSADPSGSDCEDQGEGAVSSALGSHKSPLCATGSSGPEVVGDGEGSFGSPKRIQRSYPSPVAVVGPRHAPCPVPGDFTDDVIYIRTERVLLSQTCLTAWLVARGSKSTSG